MADIVVSVGSSPVINTMNGDEYQIYKILENIEEQLSTKVDKVAGKGLSTNDYTTAEKEKLSGLPTSAESTENKVTAITSSGTDEQYPSVKAVYDELGKKQNSSDAVGKKTAEDGEVFNDYENNIASGDWSHAEGIQTTASGHYSHAEGGNSTASGDYSHAEGLFTKASGDCQHVQGRNNIEDTESKYAHIVGNGQPGDTYSNAHTLDWDGNAWYQGNIRVGGSSYDEGTDVDVKTSVTTETAATASITLIDNNEVRCSELTSLAVTVPESLTDLFTSSIVFDSGDTAAEFTTDGDAYYQGADCKYGSFLPTANNHYNMVYSYDGSILNCYVAAISTATESAETTIADDTDFTDEPVYDDMLFEPVFDESGAETEESVSDEVVS